MTLSKEDLEGLADSAGDYIIQQKLRLPNVAREILFLEEEIEKQGIAIKDTEGNYLEKKDTLFYIIKDHKLQDFEPELDNILDNIYSIIFQKLENRYDSEVFKKFLEFRKGAVRGAILQEIKNFKMVEETEKEVIVDILFGEKTWGHHIFNPAYDLRVIARVGGFFSRDRNITDIGISKDVFYQPSREEMKNSNYLANLLGYKNNEEFLKSISNNEI